MVVADDTRYEDILERIAPQPSFLQNDDISIAVHVASGITEIIETIKLNIGNMSQKELHQLNGIAVFCDADQQTAEATITKFNQEVDILKNIGLPKEIFLESSGLVGGVPIKGGIYVFPNHKDAGTLEDLLLEGAEESYSELVPLARTYIADVPTHYKEKWSGSKEKKVLIGCIANVLRPGMANQSSIYYDNWLCQNTTEKCASIRSLNEFLKNILDLR